jgi:RNA polymerase sigma factor (TIGR02999 family)
MADPRLDDTADLLRAWRDGDEKALERLIPLVENELRRLASLYLSRERRHHTLQTTALVNEAYKQLIPQREKDWQNRAHFIGVASQVMRRVLVEYARRRNAQKGPGAVTLVALDQIDGLAQAPLRNPLDVIVIDEVLTRLSTEYPRPGRIVEMRFFGGMTEEEIAEALAINKATVGRDWKLAKAWLYRELRQGESR